MEFYIDQPSVRVYGLNNALIHSGNAFNSDLIRNDDIDDKDELRGEKLGRTQTGQGHDNFLQGIIVQFNMYAPLYMWKQIQRYHFMDFVSSQSTMHTLTKFKVIDRCVSDTDPIILNRYQDMLDNYSTMSDNNLAKPAAWRSLVASLPSGFVLGASMTTNYRQLKTIYQQRKNHKLREWHDFCAWCETLPMFMELTQVEEEPVKING
jgi:hypothetical protein